ncbi:MAG: hypothetical protein DWQ07_04700 [Chloroflexi bacterium]|nr:MAG: hypothetical protein DWQ07_04700 [Chloroflexota bacterium]MBL1194730.1 hypothetical protein [Chloroflexota bacterium]NOH12023.1 hypothetical protein [Chloroflexota bacterium]
MAGFELSTTIKRPIEDVFAFISNVCVGVEIIDEIIACEKLTEGPIGLNTRFLETRLVNGNEAQAELEIMAYEPPHKVTVGGEMDGVESLYHYTLTQDSDSTLLHWEADIRAQGLRRLVLPILVGFLKTEDAKHLEKVKQALEK